MLVKRQGLQLDIYQAELNKIIFAGMPLFQILKFYYNKTCYKVTESMHVWDPDKSRGNEIVLTTDSCAMPSKVQSLLQRFAGRRQPVDCVP